MHFILKYSWYVLLQYWTTSTAHLYHASFSPSPAVRWARPIREYTLLRAGDTLHQCALMLQLAK